MANLHVERGKYLCDFATKKVRKKRGRERGEGWTIQMDLRGFRGTGSNMVVSSSFGVGLFQAR
jgi:hypothetical protein